MNAIVGELKAARKRPPPAPVAQDVYRKLCFDYPMAEASELDALASAVAGCNGDEDWPAWLTLNNKFVSGVLHIASSVSPDTAPRPARSSGEGGGDSTASRKAPRRRRRHAVAETQNDLDRRPVAAAAPGTAARRVARAG